MYRKILLKLDATLYMQFAVLMYVCGTVFAEC